MTDSSSELHKGERSDTQNACRHEFTEFIDPDLGGCVRCTKCGLAMCCEEIEEW